MPKHKKSTALFITLALLLISQASFNIEKAEACCGITGMSVDANPSALSLEESTTISGFISLWTSATRPYLTWRLTITGPASATFTESGNQTVSVTYTPPEYGEYTYTLYAWETRYGTSRTITKKFCVVSPVVTGSKTVLDGQSGGQFEVTGDPGATAWAWDFEAPPGGIVPDMVLPGNSPYVNFNPVNGDPTIVATGPKQARWYAYPDHPYWATPFPTYSILCNVTICGTTIEAEPGTLTVRVPSPPVGKTTYKFVPTTKVRFDGTKWYVLPKAQQTEMKRFVGWPPWGPPNPPWIHPQLLPNGQFRAKAEAHENRHVQQLTTGMGKDLMTKDEFYEWIKDLTAPTRQELDQKIATAWRYYKFAEQMEYSDIFAPLEEKLWYKMERDAYSVSDAIAPQYLYQDPELAP